MGLEEAVLALRAIRKSKKKKVEQETQNSLRKSLPSTFVNAVDFAQLLSPRSTPTRRMAAETIRSVRFSTVGYDDGDICEYCHQRRPTSVVSEGDIHSYLNRTSRGAAPVQGIPDDHIEFNGMSDETMLVAHQLKTVKEQRRRFEEQQKLNEVLERVQAALDHSGMKFDEDYVPSFQTDMFNIDENKAKKKERSYIYDMFEESAKLGRNRDDVMQDVENWFAVSCDDLDTFCNMKTADSNDALLLTDDHFVRIHKAFRRSSESVNKLIQALQKSMPSSQQQSSQLPIPSSAAGGKMKRRGTSRSRLALPFPTNNNRSNSTTNSTIQRTESQLIANGGDLDSEEESVVTEHKIRMNRKIFTENECNNSKGMQQAFKLINTLLTDGTKYAASAQAKGCYKIGAKQLKVIIPVWERKMELIAELDARVKTLVGEVTHLKFEQQNNIHDKPKIKQLLSENQQIRDEMQILQHDVLMERQKAINAEAVAAAAIANAAKNDEVSKEPSTSRHVSIMLPKDTTGINDDVSGDGDGDGGDGQDQNLENMRDSTEEVPEVSVVYAEDTPVNDADGGTLNDGNGGENKESVETLRENLKKKLSSRRNVLQPGSRTPSRNITSRQSIASKGSVTAQPMTPISAAKLELFDYDSESVSSHDQFESVVKKSEHKTDHLRQQIHMLREELRQSDDRYYEQRAELENLRQIVTSQSAANKSDVAMKEKERQLEKTIDKLQMSQRLLKKEVSDKREDLSAKQQTIDTLQQQLNELIKERESLKAISNAASVEKPSSPPRVTIPMTADIAQMPRDQLIKKITRQSEIELNRLRKFIINEQQRFQANLRRSNLESSKQFSKLRNEHAHLVRGITHFKDTVEGLLRGENIADDDAQESVSTMSVCVNINSGGEHGTVEGLVALERRLYNIFMHKKLSLKHTNATKVSTEKDLEQCRTQLQKRNVDYTDQQQLVKRVEVRNEMLTRQCKQLAYVNQNLQRELEPCKEIMKKQQSMHERVEKLKSSEKEQQRETQQLTKELEADRNRLKKEVNQLMLAQICPLRKSAPNKLWSRLKCSQKKTLVEKAHNMNQITKERKDAGTEILEFCNQIVVQQFADLVSRYMDLRKFKRIKEAVKAAASRHNHDIRFSKYLDSMIKRHHEAKSIWIEHCDAIRAERERAFLLLKQVLGDSFEDFVVPSIQLSKPTYPKPPKCDPLNAGSASRINAQLPVTTVIGQCMTTGKTGKQTYWQMPPDNNNKSGGVGECGNNFAKVTVPRILALDIEKSRQPRIATQKVKSYLPPIAEMFP